MTRANIPEELRYSREDEWVRREDGRVVVGITDYAQDQLGDIVYVELPEVGAIFAKGESFGVVESVKTVSDLFSPIGGEVVEVNPELVDRPEALNDSCYDEGWIVALATSDPGELDSLLDADGYRKHVEDRSE